MLKAVRDKRRSRRNKNAACHFACLLVYPAKTEQNVFCANAGCIEGDSGIG